MLLLQLIGLYVSVNLFFFFDRCERKSVERLVAVIEQDTTKEFHIGKVVFII